MTGQRRRLGLESRELRVFAWSAAILFVAGASHVAVKNASEALFVKRVGVEQLPLVFLVNAALLVVTTYAFGRLAARVGALRLLRGSLVLLAASLVPLWLLVQEDVFVGFRLLVVASKQIESISLLGFWVAMGSLLHARQAKRLYAPLTAGGTLGTTLGSFASEPLGRWLGVEGLLPLAAVLLLASAVLSWPLSRLRPARLDAEAGVLERRPAARRRPGSAGEGVSLRELWRGSWLFRALVGCSLAAGLLGPILYIQFQYVANQAAGDEEQLLALYAQVRGWLYLAVLVVQVAVAPRLYRRLGIPLATVLSPLLYLAGLAGLTVRLSLPVGIGALTGVTVQDHAVYDPAQRIFFGLFPERARARVTALIEGSFKRVGGVGGNLLVLAALATGGAAWVGYVGIPIAALWLLTTLLLWRRYPSLLLQVVSSVRGPAREAAVADGLDARTARALARHLADADSERRRAAIELVARAQPVAAVVALAHAAPRAAGPARTELTEALDAVVDDLPADAAVPRAALGDLAELLARGDGAEPAERARLVRLYGRLAPRAGLGRRAQAVLRPHANDPSPAVRLAAAGALARSGLLEPDEPALDAALADAVASDDPALRAIACAELTSLLRRQPPGGAGAARERFDRRLSGLLALLAREEDRAAAALALARVAATAAGGMRRAREPLLALRDDPDPRVRAAVLRFIGHAGLGAESRTLVEALASHDPGVARAAVEGLRALGSEALDLLILEACFGRRSHRDAVVELLGELQLEHDTLRGLVDRELTAIRQTLVRLAALSGGPVAEIVLQRLQERVEESVHTALLLLSALHHEGRIAELGDLLRHVRSLRRRVVLLEALEALLAPEERARLLPLIDERALRARAAAAASALGTRVPTLEHAIREILEDPDPITRALLAATLSKGDDGGARPREDAATPEEPMLSDVEIVLHLKSLPIFDRLTTRQLTDLASVVRQEVHPTGAVLVREGEFDDCLYLIVDGVVRISKGGVHLRDLGRREFFGEMAMFDGAERSATATALERVHLLRIERYDLARLMEELPAIAIAICQTLSRRLRDMSDRAQS